MVQVPEFPKELVYPINAVRVPRLELLQRPQKHLVQAQGICSVALDDVVRVDDIVFGLGHFFHFCPAVVLAIFKDKFSSGQVRSPRLKLV